MISAVTMCSSQIKIEKLPLGIGGSDYKNNNNEKLNTPLEIFHILQ